MMVTKFQTYLATKLVTKSAIVCRSPTTAYVCIPTDTPGILHGGNNLITSVTKFFPSEPGY